MALSGKLLHWLFRALPRGYQVDLVLETPMVHEAVKACADITTMKFDDKTFCRLEEWRCPINT
jgi:hypothetical protein